MSDLGRGETDSKSNSVDLIPKHVVKSTMSILAIFVWHPESGANEFMYNLDDVYVFWRNYEDEVI